ncbi:MAG: tetratricopeptide repeat protein [bacterium]
MTYFSFSEFLLDGKNLQLYFRGHQVALQPKAMEVLLYLVRNSDKTISRNDLMDVVWKERIVTENSLSHALSKIRIALREKRLQKPFIQTRHRVGLTFAAPVVTLSEQEFTQLLTQSGVTNTKNRPLNDHRLENEKIQRRHFYPDLFKSSLAILLGATFLYVLFTDRLSDRPTHPVEPENFAFITENSTTEKREPEHGELSAISLLFNQVLVFSQIIDPIALKLKSDEGGVWKSVESLGEQKLILIERQEILHDGLYDRARQQVNLVCDQTALAESCDQLTRFFAQRSRLVIENYLQALQAIQNYQLEQAEKMLRASLSLEPEFLLAEWQLATLYYEQSKLDLSTSEASVLLQSSRDSYAYWSGKVLTIQALWRNGSLDKALKNLEALITDKVVRSFTQKSTELLLKGQILEESESFEEAVQTLDTLLTMLAKKDIPRLRGQAFAVKGDALFGMGQLDKAEDSYLKAADIFNQYQLFYGLSGVYSSLGLISEYKGDYKQSLAYAKRRSILVAVKKDPIEMVGVELQLSSINHTLGNFSDALLHANKAWNISADQSEPVAVILSDYMIGIVETARKNYALARQHILQSLSDSEKINAPLRQLQATTALFSLAIEKEDRLLFEQYKDQHKELATEVDSSLFLAVLYLYESRFDYLDKKYQKSTKQLNIAKQYLSKIHHPRLSFRLLQQAVKLELLKDFNEARKLLQTTQDAFKKDYHYWLLLAQVELAAGNLTKATTAISRSRLIARDWWGVGEQKILTEIEKKARQ